MKLPFSLFLLTSTISIVRAAECGGELLLDGSVQTAATNCFYNLRLQLSNHGYDSARAAMGYSVGSVVGCSWILCNNNDLGDPNFAAAQQDLSQCLGTSHSYNNGWSTVSPDYFLTYRFYGSNLKKNIQVDSKAYIEQQKTSLCPAPPPKCVGSRCTNPNVVGPSPES